MLVRTAPPVWLLVRTGDRHAYYPWSGSARIFALSASCNHFLFSQAICSVAEGSHVYSVTFHRRVTGSGVAVIRVYVERHRKLRGTPSCVDIHILLSLVVLLKTSVAIIDYIERFIVQTKGRRALARRDRSATQIAGWWRRATSVIGLDHVVG